LRKLHLNFKIFTCYSSPIFYTNVLLHNTNFDPKSSFARNMALTTSIPSSTKRQGFFFTVIAYTKLKKDFIENHATKQ